MLVLTNMGCALYRVFLKMDLDIYAKGSVANRDRMIIYSQRV
jgi:hypothetical protein